MAMLLMSHAHIAPDYVGKAHATPIYNATFTKNIDLRGHSHARRENGA
jgi:hypothetical protein